MKTPGGVVRHEGYTTDIITDVALDWLKNKRDKTEAVLPHVSAQGAAPQLAAAPRHLDKYKDVKIAEPETLFDDYSGREKPAAENEMSVAKHLTPQDLKLVPPGGQSPAQEAAFMKAYEKENDELKAALLDAEAADAVELPAVREGLPPLRRCRR